MRQCRHGDPGNNRSNRRANALHDQQSPRGRHELVFAHGVIHVSHNDAVGRYDGPAEKSSTEVEYPAGRVVRYDAIMVKRVTAAVIAAPMMTRRRSRRSESQPSGQANRNPPRVPLAMNAATPPVSSPRCSREDWAQSEEGAGGHPTQGGGHQPEGRLPIQFP